MNLDELTQIIETAGGGCFALEYADALLIKINQVEASRRYAALLRQLRSARQSGDLRGRVLEVNFAEIFLKQGQQLEYGARQGSNGDVDFCWHIKDRAVFIELKLLGQDQATKESINLQLDTIGISSTLITYDTRDIARTQLDLIQKASTRKFNPKPEKHWINLIGIDVSELQLGTADLCDCLLAAGGNAVASEYYKAAALRPEVVGIFERLAVMSQQQTEWVTRVHTIPEGVPHPRDYIHGALFLFREPKETAALSYSLSSAIVWNAALVTRDAATIVEEELYRLIPRMK